MKHKHISSLLGLIVFCLLGAQAYASVESLASCPSNASGSCDACFRVSDYLYTCNPHQASCQKDMVVNLSDTSSNESGSSKFMRQSDPGTIDLIPLQTGTTSWSKQDTAPNMFELTNPGFFTPAPAVGQKGYQLAASGNYGHLLPVGTSVVWTAMTSSAWLRPDLAQSGASRTLPAYQVNFTPRLYLDDTNYIDHKQCVFLFVRYCGDGTHDLDRGEQCDDGNMTSGDGCSNTCQTETADPVCTNLTASPTVVETETSVTFTCNAVNATSYSIEVRRPDGSVLQTLTSATGSVTIPATPDGTYSATCTINGSVSSPACNVDITNNPTATCDSLTASPSTVQDGGNVQLSCSGTHATSYRIDVSGPGGFSQTINGSSGTVSVPAVPTGSFSARCYVNNTISSNACVTSFENTSTPTPRIEIIKDDNEVPHNDYQLVNIAGTATFNITVRNNGTEDLRDVVITDALAPNCSLSASQTATLIQQVGNNDTIFDIGESFSYVCSRSNVQEDTFPNDLNEICVNGTGNTSGIVDSDCDDTEIETPDPDPRIRIVKDDSDNHDDRQRVDIGGRARFDITVTNNGDEPLENVVIDDPRAPDCDRSASETRSLISNVGNDDAVLDPGESFNYTCDRSNVREDTFPNDTNEICVDGRGVDSGEQVNDCDPTRIFTEDDDPDIQIIKDDADNHDDRQRIISGEVRFDIAVVNSGDVSLEDVVIRDPRARECDRSASETEDLYPGRTFDPGERFGYTCRVFDVDYDDFPGGRNEICVEAEEEDGNDEVRDCDDTRIDPGRIEHGRCDRLDVNASRGIGELRAEFTCHGDARDRYRLDILTRSGNLLRTLTSSDGEFEHRFDDGEYIARCRVDDEVESRSACERRIEVEDRQICQDVRSSNGTYGAAPFKTHIECDARPQDHCTIEVIRRVTGDVISRYDVCERDLKFRKDGEYQVQCIVNGRRDANRCSTNISVDSPTKPKTGAMGIVLVLLVLGVPAIALLIRRKLLG